MEYRIAYLVLCLEDSKPGRELLGDLSTIASKDPEFIQFGSAEWFWERQVNSYAIQVEPERFMYQDRARVDFQEAKHIEMVRDEFFREIRGLLLHRIR